MFLPLHDIGETPPDAPTRAVNDVAQGVLTPLTWFAVLVIVVIAVRMGRRRATWVPVAMVLAAAVNSLNEPLFDAVYHMYWYRPGQWTLLNTYGYPQPVWVMSAYVMYYCIPGLYIWRKVTVAASGQWVFKAVLVSAGYGATFESVAIKIGTYRYFADQPFRVVGDYPVWLGVMEGCHIVIWAVLAAKFSPLLTGRRVLLVVPMFAISFCSVMFGAGGAALGSINVPDVSTPAMYACALVSLALAGCLVWLATLLLPSHDAEGVDPTALHDQAGVRLGLDVSTRLEREPA